MKKEAEVTLGFLLLVGTLLTGCATPGSTKATEVSPRTTVPLSRAITETEEALKDYQTYARAQHLPKLKTAVFDFKTVTDTKATASASGLLGVLKLNASADASATHHISYTYEVPPPKPKAIALFAFTPPPPLKQELSRTIKSAAEAIAGNKTVAGLPFEKMGVEVAFAFTWSGDVGVGVPIYLVTVGADVSVSKASTQTVTLTFQD